MNAPRRWKLLCLVLLVANAVTIRLWFGAQWDYAEAAEIVANKDFERGLLDAERDFHAGIVRVYMLETHERPKLPLQATSLLRGFTGRKDGPFEIWSWPRYRLDRGERLDLMRDSMYVDTYNARMKVLSEHSINRTNRSVHLTNDPSQ